MNSVPFYLFIEIEWFINRFRMKRVFDEMKKKFVQTRYDYFVYALDYAFRHENLFEHGYMGVVQTPIIQYGDLQISRTRVPPNWNDHGDHNFVIRILTGYGYFFVYDNLFLRSLE